MTPFCNANMAISLNHILFMGIGPIAIVAGLGSLPIWWAMAALAVPMFAIDAVVWPLVYRATKRSQT